MDTLVSIVLMLLLAQAPLSPQASDPDRRSRTLEGGRVVFEEQFSGSRTDWQTGEDLHVREGELIVGANRGELYVTGSEEAFDVADVIVEADVSSEDADEGAVIGVVCRWTYDEDGDPTGYYAFVINRHGYAAISTPDEVLWEAEARIDGMNIGPGVVNRLRAECIDDRLVFRINETTVATITDRTIERGDFGVLLDNFDQRRATMRVDDVRVIQVR